MPVRDAFQWRFNTAEDIRNKDVNIDAVVDEERIRRRQIRCNHQLVCAALLTDIYRCKTIELHTIGLNFYLLPLCSYSVRGDHSVVVTVRTWSFMPRVLQQLNSANEIEIRHLLQTMKVGRRWRAFWNKSASYSVFCWEWKFSLHFHQRLIHLLVCLKWSK